MTEDDLRRYAAEAAREGKPVTLAGIDLAVADDLHKRTRTYGISLDYALEEYSLHAWEANSKKEATPMARQGDDRDAQLPPERCTAPERHSKGRGPMKGRLPSKSKKISSTVGSIAR